METPTGLRGRMEYNTDLFDEATIERMLEHYQVLLEAAVANPALPVSELPLLTRGERQQLLADWNATEFDYPRDLCLHELFEQQVERAPDAVACVFDGQSLSYARTESARQSAGTLSQAARRRSGTAYRHVRRAFAGDDGRPAGHSEVGRGLRAARSVVSGRALASDPRRRAGAGAADPAVVARRPCPSIRRKWSVSIPTGTKIAAHSTANPTSGATPEDLVYVIFTSGSTGRPKGVQVPHRAVVNLLTFMAAGTAHGSRTMSFPALASFAFDMCIPELYLALVSGGRVVIGDRHLAANGEELAALLRADRRDHRARHADHLEPAAGSRIHAAKD